MTTEIAGVWRRVSLQEVRQVWGWVMAAGIAFMILGVLAAALSTLTTLTSMVVLGLFMLIGGAVQLVQAFRSPAWGGFLFDLFIGALYAIAGLVILGNPMVGAAALTVLMAAFFIAQGVFRSFVAAVVRLSNWGLVLASGLASILLGLLIWAQWPASALWAIGLFIGVDLFLNGLALTILASEARAFLRIAAPSST